MDNNINHEIGAYMQSKSFTATREVEEGKYREVTTTEIRWEGNMRSELINRIEINKQTLQ